MEFELQELKRNRGVFESLLKGLSEEEYKWREKEGKWNLLEIVCHLYDEEREDFRARVKSVLEDPEKHLVAIDPVGWVISRNYAGQSFDGMLKKFLEERYNSIAWLDSLSSPKWDNTYEHPKLGPLSAKLFLSNWVAHDYLHIRQITRIRYHYLQLKAGVPLDYAGEW